ncbi:MAG: 16S rRNA processing protein RimM [Anaerolineae bacterium]|nr:16S rRNA processing protein RimM [Anaerolineae bacterium]
MPKKQPEPRYLVVGRILRPHGVRGELRAEILTDYPQHLAEVHTLYVGDDYQPYTLQAVRFHQNVMLLTLKDCADRDAAEGLRGALVSIAIKDAVPLEEDEYYHFQLVGLQVVGDEGEALGEIVEVFTAPGANDVYVVHGSRGEILLPAISEVVKHIDVEAKRMVVHLLPGLIN